MLTYVLYGLFVLSCFVLILAVLLQPGKADAGALFTSSVSSTAFGPRGTQTLLAKITIGAAAVFMLIALTLALPGLTGSRSVLQSQPEEAAPTPQPTASATPSSPGASPAAPGGSPQGASGAGAAPTEGTNTESGAPAASPEAASSPAPQSSPEEKQQQ